MNKCLRIMCAAWLFALLVFAPLRFGRVSQAENLNRQEESEEQFVPGRVLVKFRSGAQAGHVRDLLASQGARDKGEIGATGVRIVELPAQASEEASMRVFQSMPDVEFAELDRILPPEEMTPNDPWYAGWEWYLPKISAPSAWATTTGSSSVTIAILDSGVDAAHEDIASKLVPGWNTYNNNSDTNDVYGHGTNVAGTAAASSNNGVGVASVAWGCKIMPVRVSDTSGNATYSAIASGLNWAADHGARVANISYIVSGSSAVTSAAKYFQSKGGVVTSSAGNYSTFDSSADNPYILTISGTDKYDARAVSSNYGNNIDLGAPIGVYTTVRGGGYVYASGTSFSAPIVAGVAALVLSVNPSLTAIQVQDILKQSADDLGTAGWDSSYGWGRVNAARAVNLASGGATPADNVSPTVSFTTPAAGAAISGTVLVQVAASDNVGVTSVSLKVDGNLIGTDTAAPYTFSLNTTAMANGACTLTVTASDASGNASSASNAVMVSNTSDTVAPQVAIISPTSGTTVSANVNVQVGASDNVAVKKVELYADGLLVATSTAQPFTMKWNSRKASAGGHTLLLRAYDAAGNVGVSSTVTVYK